MTEVLIYPSSSDHARIALVISALEEKGIQARQLDKIAPNAFAPIVIFWTRASVARAEQPDQTIRACATSGRLVSVLMEKTAVPPDFPTHPVIDLANWRGSSKNAFFGDLVATLRAAAECAPPPRPKGPLRRLVKRLCGGLTIAAVATFLFGFMLNVLGLQNNLCSIGFVQPNISDYCGYFGLGGKPTKTERLAWEGRPPGSCEAIRHHVDEFENSAFLARASALLDARRIVVDEAWIPDTQRAVFSQSFATQGAPDEQTAKKTAVTDGQRWAEEGCRAFAQSDLYTFKSVDLEVEQWDCFSMQSGYFCGFDGYRTCNLERLVKTNREVCGEVE